MVVNVRRGDPLRVDLELEAGLPVHEVHRQVQRQDEREDRYDQREDFNVAIAAREEQQQQRASKRYKRYQAEDEGMDIFGFHRVPFQIIKTTTAAAPAATHPA